MIAFVNFDDADFVTHSGKFHADEVMATAVLQELHEAVYSGEILEEELPEILRGKFGNAPLKLCRISAIPEDSNVADKMIYDVGGGEFDHHQKERNGMRENGIYYASLGLVWRKFGKYLCNGSDWLVQAIDERLIQAIDCGDNGQFPVISNGLPILNLDELLGAFNPRWNEDQSFDYQNECFEQAVECAKTIFEQFLKKEKAILEAFPIVEQALEESDGNIVVLDKYMPWEDVILELSKTNEKARGLLFAIFPSNRDKGAYIIQSPREENKSRLLMPEEWRGKRGEDLNDLAEGGVFCHATGFMAVADSLEHAVSMAKLAIHLGV